MLSAEAEEVRGASELEHLGAVGTVQDRMARIAEHYVDETREMLEDDPDLGIDMADPPPGAADATVQEPALPPSSGDGEPAAQMSDAEIRRAFAEIAENYEEISRKVFGEVL